MASRFSFVVGVVFGGRQGICVIWGFLSSGLAVALLIKDLLLAPGALPPQWFFFFGLGSEIYSLQCCGMFNVDVCP